MYPVVLEMSKYRLNKHVERNILREVFNTERNLNQSLGGADGRTEWLEIEIFARPIPKFMLEELEQAKTASNGKRLAIAVWHEKGKPYGDAIVYMRLKDFTDNFGH